MFTTASFLLGHSHDMVRSLRAAILAAGLLAATAGAASAECVPMAQARSVIQSGEVIPFAQAIRAARGSAEGEMIDSRLCRGGGGYQYVVTFLGSDGRVKRVTVDGRSGRVAGVR
jgi:uncharacterized membrane protein YkoI